MGNFGQELRRERESRGIALETITGDTKISGRYLSCLEEGQFGALPGGVLSKGIVRGYARVVGLDEEDCVQRYLAACRLSGLDEQEDAGWAEFASNVGRNRKGEFVGRTGLQWAGVALLLTLLAVFGWYVAHFVQGRVSQAALAPVRSAPLAPLPVGSDKAAATFHVSNVPESTPLSAPIEQAAQPEQRELLPATRTDKDVRPSSSHIALAEPDSNAAPVDAFPAESTPVNSPTRPSADRVAGEQPNPPTGPGSL